MKIGSLFYWRLRPLYKKVIVVYMVFQENFLTLY